MKIDDINSVENAKYVVLSLLRELDILRQKDINTEDYTRQIEQLRNDLRYYDEKELINKVKEIYLPYLKILLEKNHGV